MKQKVLSLAILCALNLLFAFACKKGENANTNDTAYTSTTVAASDTSGTTTTNPATSSTTGTSTTNPAPLTEAEQKFMEKAAFGGLAEVALGQQVSLKAKDADVKGFADKMVTDHGKANDELKELASNKKVTLPREPDHEQQAAAKKVMSAKNIDKAYMEDMVKDHDKDVKEFENESKSATDPDLKAWIDKTLPVLKEHQKMAHDINSKLK